MLAGILAGASSTWTGRISQCAALFPGRLVSVSELCQCYVDRVPFSNVHVGKLVNRLSVWSCLLLWVRSEAQHRVPRAAGTIVCFVIIIVQKFFTYCIHTVI